MDKSPNDLASKLSPGGAQFVRFPSVSDPRGNLMFAEFPKHLPFQPKRFFVTYEVPMGSVRGEHAHKSNDQVIVCLKGSLTITLDDGTIRKSFELNAPDVGIYIPAGIWGIQSHHSADCVMLVLASELYDENGYIRDYGDFLEYLKAKGKSTKH